MVNLRHYPILEPVSQYSHSDSPGVIIDRRFFLVDRRIHRVFAFSVLVPQLVRLLIFLRNANPTV